MQISGYQPLTLSDYPGKTAAIVFTQGCNMACPYCHNSQLIACTKGDLDTHAILHTLEQRKKMLQGVVITGGEPTVQKNLAAFCQQIQDMGLRVKLDTNGSRPRIVKQLIETKLIDYVAMDIKAPLNKPDKHMQLTGSPIPVDRIEQTMQLIRQSGIAHHFRTTAYKTLLNQEDLELIQIQIPKTSLHVMQNYVPQQIPNERGRSV
ncbi:MAG: anaerobic ribonucleoside-triphosphate reductase activating protein [Phycisphaeraceae bacterium JB051]